MLYSQLWQLCKHNVERCHQYTVKQKAVSNWVLPQLACESSLQGPPEVIGDRDRIARKTLEFHPAHTSLLFKNCLLETDVYVIIHFFKSRNHVFIVTHCHRQAVKPMAWPQSASERAPAGLQKRAQACLHTSHISSVVPVIKALHQPGTE